MANTRFSTSIDIDNKRVEINVPYGSSAWQKANCIFNPLGPAPTKGWFVMTKGALDELDLNEAHTVNWTQYITDADSGAIVSSTALAFQGMYIVSSERVLHGGVADTNALHLVELADARYLLAKKSDTGQLVANLRPYANSANYLTGTTTYGTWSNLVSALWSACGLLGSFPDLPPSLPIDGEPQNHWFIGLNAYRALCVVLDQLDCALKQNPFSNTYTIVQLGENQTIADNNSTLKWNGEPQNSNVASQAATLKVYFHNYRKGYGQERDTELANNWAYNGHTYSLDKSTGIDGAQGTLGLWDDLPAVYDETGQISNETELGDRATNRKDRYVSRHTIAYQHRLHRGLTSSYLPGGSIRACLWRNWNDGIGLDGNVNPFGGTSTEFICTNHLVHDFRITGKDEPAWFDKLLDTPEWFQYSSADLGKHTYPNYPRIANIVQVYHPAIGDDLSVYPGGTYNLHRGRIRRWVNNELVVLDDCWILFVDNYDTKAGFIPARQGDLYGPARLSGITTDTDEHGTATLPVYLVRKGSTTGSSGEIVVFQLTEALVKGTTETASAYLCVLGAGLWTADNSQPITVGCGYSSIGRLWTAPIGSKGLAYQRLDGIYEIVYMTRYDMFIPFQASETPSQGYTEYSAASLLGFQHGDITPSSITVHDPNQVFPSVVDGAYGLAVWDDENSRYLVVFVEQAAITAKAKINNATTGLQFGDVGNINVTQFVSTSPRPFGLDPDPIPTVAYNKFGFRGKDDDEVWLEWDEDRGEWVVVQIINREKSYVVKPLASQQKGTTPVNCEIYINGVATGRIIACVPLGADVTANKWCSAWTEPSSGVIYVAPWECA